VLSVYTTLFRSIRIIVDSCGRIPLDSRVLNIRSDAETIIAVTDRAEKDKIRSLEEKGARVIILPSKEGRVDLNFLMKELGERKIDSILLEGGSQLNYAALEKGIVDKVNVFIDRKIIGDRKSVV